MATPAEQALSLTNRLFGELAQRRPDIQKAYEYLDGKQPLVFATDEWRDFHADRYAGFSDNWTEVVAQAPVDRLRIDGFRASSSAESLTDDEKQLWSDWQVNELGAQSNQGF